MGTVVGIGTVKEGQAETKRGFRFRANRLRGSLFRRVNDNLPGTMWNAQGNHDAGPGMAHEADRTDLHIDHSGRRSDIVRGRT